MDSFFARNRLSAYLDRTLPKSEAEAVSEAIARDISLSADLQSVRQAITLLHESGRTDAPTGFQARCLAAIAEQPVPGSQVAWLQRRMSRIPTELVALVGAALIVGIALQTGQPSEPSKENTPVGQNIRVAEPVEPTAAHETKASTAEGNQVDQDATETAPIVESTRPKRPARKSISTPDTPFSTTSPLAYRILHGGDQVLYDIAAIADASSGRLVDAQGKLYSPHSLNEARSFSQLYLITPKSMAAKAHKKLTTRSGMSPYPLEGPTPPITENEFVFLIEAQL